MTPINTSRKAFHLLRHLGRLEVEEFWIVALHANKKLIGRECVFRGTVDACPVYPRDVFRAACRWNASSLVVSHNHPSGDPAPSTADIEITRNLIEAGELLGIKVVDHLIIAGKKYWSFADAGLLIERR
jgi:DNA repair protein RadC